MPFCWQGLAQAIAETPMSLVIVSCLLQRFDQLSSGQFVLIIKLLLLLMSLSDVCWAGSLLHVQPHAISCSAPMQ
jgi:hypothetical protein